MTATKNKFDMPDPYWPNKSISSPSGKTNCSGKHSTIDLLIKMACFEKSKFTFAISKAADLVQGGL